MARNNCLPNGQSTNFIVLCKGFSSGYSLRKDISFHILFVHASIETYTGQIATIDAECNCMYMSTSCPVYCHNEMNVI